MTKAERRLRRQPPDLQELVRKFGTYPQITPEAWAQYDREVERWKKTTCAMVGLMSRSNAQALAHRYP